jgi:hypothetical protein
MVEKRGEENMKKVIILFCVGLFLGVTSQASAIDNIFGIEGLRFDGYLKNATAMRLHHEYDFMKFDNILDLRLTYEPKAYPIKFHIDIRPEYDGAFDMQHKGVGRDTGLEPENRGIGISRRQLASGEDIFPGSRKGNLRVNWEDSYMARTFLLRELWGEVKIGNFDIRLGKQQVAWGKTDGYKLLDVLNPTDYREFILMESEDSRIPIWMANIKYYFTPKHNLQFIWMPDYVANFQALPGYIWTLNPINTVHQLGTLPFIRIIDKEPANNLRNSDIGFRYEGQIGTKFDFTLNYLHRWDQNNVWMKSERIIFTPTPPFFALIFLEEPKRQNIFGGSFTTTFDKILGIKDLVMRGEFAYYYHRTMYTVDNPGPIQRDNIQAMIGFDKNVWFVGKSWMVSVQLFEDFIKGNYPDDKISSLGGGKKKRHEVAFTSLISTDFINQKLKPEVLLIWDTTQGDGWVRPRVSYEFSDNLKATAGFNFFWGKRDDSLGQMTRNDQIFAEIKYSF